MKLLLILAGVFFLLVVGWPLALLMLVLWPLACLIAIPLAIVGIHMSAPVALLALVAALLYVPAKVLGYRV